MLKARAVLVVGFVTVMLLLGLGLVSQVQNLGEGMKNHMHSIP